MKKVWTICTGSLAVCFLLAGAAWAQVDGKAVVQKSCAACHGIKKVESAKKNAAEWEATLDRMIKKGAKVKPEERAAVLKYLTTFK